MFEIGSYVIYRSEGVCQISDIRQEHFGTAGVENTYYILTPLNDPKSTLFVPTDNEKLVGMMRRLLSAEEICRMAEEVRSERLEWIPESRARNNVFRELLSIGDRRTLMVMVNTVEEHLKAQIQQGKKPTATDQNVLRRAKKLLIDEFSATTNLRTEEEVSALLRGEWVPSAR